MQYVHECPIVLSFSDVEMSIVINTRVYCIFVLLLYSKLLLTVFQDFESIMYFVAYTYLYKYIFLGQSEIFLLFLY